jgi:hypothetical protein
MVLGDGTEGAADGQLFYSRGVAFGIRTGSLLLRLLAIASSVKISNC